VSRDVCYISVHKPLSFLELSRNIKIKLYSKKVFFWFCINVHIKGKTWVKCFREQDEEEDIYP